MRQLKILHAQRAHDLTIVLFPASRSNAKSRARVFSKSPAAEVEPVSEIEIIIVYLN